MIGNTISVSAAVSQNDDIFDAPYSFVTLDLLPAKCHVKVKIMFFNFFAYPFFAKQYCLL